MTPQTKADVQQAALALNGADKPFVISATGDQIAGKWNVLDAKWYGIISQNKADQNYSITVTLDEATHTYTYSEVTTSSSSSVGLGGFSYEKSTFKGKQYSFNAGTLLGLGMQNKGSDPQAVGTATYSFDTGQIKKPLLDALAQAGWSEKPGFFKRLFGRK